MRVGNIYLVGMMGTGKTTIGGKLAERLNQQFIDLDEYIEEEQGRKISEIFAKEGEVFFRELETEALLRIRERLLETREQFPKDRSVVVATGGGAFEREINRNMMKDSGIVIWLSASIGELYKRLEHDTARPLLQSNDLTKRKQHISELLSKREPNYCLADIHVITEGKTIEEVIREILAHIQ